MLPASRYPSRMADSADDTAAARQLWADDAPIRVGISSCLLGQKVRFDGGHKRDRFLTDILAPYVEWVPVCPEVELGMGIPRESIRLVRDDGALRLRAERSGKDHTRAMERFAAHRVRELGQLELCGYVLKKDSPSRRRGASTTRACATTGSSGCSPTAGCARCSALAVGAGAGAR